MPEDQSEYRVVAAEVLLEGSVDLRSYPLRGHARTAVAHFHTLPAYPWRQYHQAVGRGCVHVPAQQEAGETHHRYPDVRHQGLGQSVTASRYG